VRHLVVAVSRYDIELAFAFVNSDAPMMHHAYISLDTGQIYWVSELNPTEQELPDDFETSDRYIALPHKNALGLGRNLALSFAEDELPNRYREVAAIFHRKGAYHRFKNLLESVGLLEKWYKFEEAALDRALQDWCAENDVQIVEASNGRSV
jgi:hypothetical protein